MEGQQIPQQAGHETFYVDPYQAHQQAGPSVAAPATDLQSDEVFDTTDAGPDLVQRDQDDLVSPIPKQHLQNEHIRSISRQSPEIEGPAPFPTLSTIMQCHGFSSAALHEIRAGDGCLQILPIGRVKRIIKMESDVKAVSAEASYAVARATVSHYLTMTQALH